MVYPLTFLAVINIMIVWWITLSIARFYVVRWIDNRWLKRFASEDCCMCGTEMKYHSVSDNHAPLSQYDFYRRNLVEKKLDWFWRKV